jgi:hypothetical protein
MEDLQKDFVPYELAIRMKQLEFDEPCFSYYMNGILQPSLNVKDYSYFKEMIEINSNIKNFENVLAPLFQQAFRWFREEYNIDCGIHVYSEMDFKTEEIIKKYTGRVDNWNVIWSIHDGTGLMMPEHYHFETSSYEEVELACLEKLLEIVEEKQK